MTQLLNPSDIFPLGKSAMVVGADRDHLNTWQSSFIVPLHDALFTDTGHYFEQIKHLLRQEPHAPKSKCHLCKDLVLTKT